LYIVSVIYFVLTFQDLRVSSKFCQNYVYLKLKLKVKQSFDRPITDPEGSRRLRLAYFKTIGT